MNHSATACALLLTCLMPVLEGCFSDVADAESSRALQADYAELRSLEAQRRKDVELLHTTQQQMQQSFQSAAQAGAPVSSKDAKPIQESIERMRRQVAARDIEIQRQKEKIATAQAAAAGGRQPR
jgi:hypothetical protein